MCLVCFLIEKILKYELAILKFMSCILYIFVFITSDLASLYFKDNYS